MEETIGRTVNSAWGSLLKVADLTAGTGRFNLIQGLIGTVIAVAAAISTGGSGFGFQHLGHLYGFLILAAIAVSATLLLWTALTETKPGQYLD